MLGIADDAGDVPGAGEQERGKFLGYLAMAAEEEDLHCVRGIGRFIDLYFSTRL